MLIARAARRIILALATTVCLTGSVRAQGVPGVPEGLPRYDLDVKLDTAGRVVTVREYVRACPGLTVAIDDDRIGDRWELRYGLNSLHACTRDIKRNRVQSRFRVRAVDCITQRTHTTVIGIGHNERTWTWCGCRRRSRRRRRRWGRGRVCADDH